GNNSPENPWILASNLISIDWKMLHPDHFQCRIKVPRRSQGAAHRSVEEFSDNPSITDCHDVQRAPSHRPTDKLQIDWSLDMRYHIASPSVSGLSNEMILQSGLEGLEAPNVEELDVWFVNHRIGFPEPEWISENWPNMKKMYGLF
ncbi:hypothetical protein CPC16_001919, partial [Podila verticillata]